MAFSGSEHRLFISPFEPTTFYCQIDSWAGKEITLMVGPATGGAASHSKVLRIPESGEELWEGDRVSRLFMDLTSTLRTNRHLSLTFGHRPSSEFTQSDAIDLPYRNRAGSVALRPCKHPPHCSGGAVVVAEIRPEIGVVSEHPHALSVIAEYFAGVTYGIARRMMKGFCYDVRAMVDWKRDAVLIFADLGSTNDLDDFYGAIRSSLSVEASDAEALAVAAINQYTLNMNVGRALDARRSVFDIASWLFSGRRMQDGPHAWQGAPDHQVDQTLAFVRSLRWTSTYMAFGENLGDICALPIEGSKRSPT